MSSNVNDILGAISAASEALAREPSLRSTINDLNGKLEAAQSHNMGLENNIVTYKATIDSLNDKVRSLEVERDHAQFRTLELEEAHTLLANSLRKIGVDIGNAVLVVDPPKPQPPVEEPVALSVASDPTQDTSMYGGAPAEQVLASPAPTTSPTSDSGMGSMGSPASQGSGSQSNPTPTADPVGFAGLSEADVKPKPYEGKQWSKVEDRPYSLTTWLEGGGTNEGWNS